MTIIIETERLYLRTWKPNDAQSFWAINQDARVFEFLLGPMSMDEVDQFMQTQNQQQAQRNFACWPL